MFNHYKYRYITFTHICLLIMLFCLFIIEIIWINNILILQNSLLYPFKKFNLSWNRLGYTLLTPVLDTYLILKYIKKIAFSSTSTALSIIHLYETCLIHLNGEVALIVIYQLMEFFNYLFKYIIVESEYSCFKNKFFFFFLISTYIYNYLSSLKKYLSRMHRKCHELSNNVKFIFLW